MRIYEATEPSDLLAEAFARLLPQLSERMTAPDREAVARIVASPATRQLVAAAEDGRIVGLLSVALYDVPSGRKAWIEDVVVDAAARGARSRHRRGAGTRSAGVGAPRGRRTSDAHLECDAQGGPPAL